MTNIKELLNLEKDKDVHPATADTNAKPVKDLISRTDRTRVSVQPTKGNYGPTKSTEKWEANLPF